MSKIHTAINLLKRNKELLLAALIRNCCGWLQDSIYLKLLYRFKMGHSLDLKNPQTFTEKIQWLKLYNRKPEYTQMVDKYAVKQYVGERIGFEYIIPTIGIWNKPEDIEWDALPKEFVLKTTHGGGGGGVVICKNRDTFDITSAISKLSKSLSSDIYEGLREWPYKNVTKRIIAEKLIKSKNSHSSELFDYKFFCFNGKVKFFKIDFGRFMEHHANYYSPEGELLNFGEMAYPPDNTYHIQLPDNLDEMIALASTLSNGEPFLRVDLYNVDGRVYFGELTFYPASGLGKWTSNDVDYLIGDYLTIDR